MAFINLLLDHERNLIEKVASASDSHANCDIDKNEELVATAATTLLLHDIIDEFVDCGDLFFHSLFCVFLINIVLELSPASKISY